MEINNFRKGHWQFVVQYIIKNSLGSLAKGPTIYFDLI